MKTTDREVHCPKTDAAVREFRVLDVNGNTFYTIKADGKTSCCTLRLFHGCTIQIVDDEKPILAVKVFDVVLNKKKPFWIENGEVEFKSDKPDNTPASIVLPPPESVTEPENKTPDQMTPAERLKAGLKPTMIDGKVVWQ